jgi:hypothetical protein
MPSFFAHTSHAPKTDAPYPPVARRAGRGARFPLHSAKRRRLISLSFGIRFSRPAFWAGSALLVPTLAAVAAEPAQPPAVRRMIEQLCIDCHDADIRKGGLDLGSVTFDLSNPKSFSTWIAVHDRVRAGVMPPKEEPQPEKTERAAFVRELEAVLAAESRREQERDGRARARRLNRDEYQATIEDLLGVSRDYRVLLPDEGRALGFDKVASALNVSAEHLQAYLAAAGAALKEALEPAPPPEKRRALQRLEPAPTRRRDPRAGSEKEAAPPVAREIGGQRPENAGNRPADESRRSRSRPFRWIYLDLPDAIVHFSDQFDHIVDFVATAPGVYRFRIRARAHQSDTPVMARIRARGGLAEEGRILVSYAEFPSAGGEVEVTAWLDKGETLFVSPIGTGGRGNTPSIHRALHRQGPTAAEYGGPGLAMEWVDIEGPINPPRLRGTLLAGIDLDRGTEQDVEKVIAEFLPRAFRRPVRDAEKQHYLDVFKAARQSDTFVVSLQVTLQSILCSPHFLYLHGPRGPLDDYALASRLSYFLWNTMPDATLMALAARGELRKPATLHAQVERLLASERSKAFRESFTGQWLELRQIDATTPDRDLYPEYDEVLGWSMVQETRAFFDDVLDHDRSLLTFIKSDFAMVNNRLALHYGIPGVEGIGIRKVTLPPGSERGGLLTQGSILKVTTNGTTSSPILRGAWVMDRLLDKPPPPPPTGTPGLEPDIRGATTIREQLAKHSKNASCAACHANIDPPGFALERFDVIGRARDRYRSTVEGAERTDLVETPIYLDVRRIHREPTSREHVKQRVGVGPVVDVSSEFNGQPFSTFQEFQALLLREDEQLARAILTKLITYATGAGVQFADRAVIDGLVQKLKSRNYGLRTTIHEVVQSPLFLNR